jgi:hypothetical protein
METLRPAHYPVPAVRKNKIAKPINTIVSVPKATVCNLSRNSPGNRPVAKIKKPTSPVVKKLGDGEHCEPAKTPILSDDDDFYSKMTFDETQQSLEDEIFEELEKVAHDEAKLNAAIQNFDKILNEYNDKRGKRADEQRPSAIPKPLQKSKTCSIIESKCILKKHQLKKSNTAPPQQQQQQPPIKVENIPSANYYQLTKSLWNLEDFESFARSADERQQRQRPAYSRQSSISKIPIKSSSNLSASMMQLNTAAASPAAAGHSSSSPATTTKLKKSTVYASTLALTSQPHNQSHKSAVAAPRRSSLNSSSKPCGNYAETKASLQRRNLMSSCNSINKVPAAVKGSASSRQSPLKAAKSEMSIHGRFALKAKQLQSRVRRSDDTALSSDSVKGQAEEFNARRDYIAKQKQQQQQMTKDVSVNTKSSSPVNATTGNDGNNEHADDVRRNDSNESEMKQPVVGVKCRQTTVTTKIVSIATPVIADEQISLILAPPTLESCELVIPDVLGDDKTVIKDYSSDCSDDSGHISNENEDLGVIAMEVKKPRKISEELLEIFEKKSPKVAELNSANLMRSTMEIYPAFNGNCKASSPCKSEVTIFINKY